MFPQNVYIGLVIGNIIFSASSGLGEALMSPVIAAIPAENPDREMSKLHSTYAWGTVVVIIVATLYIITLGIEKWQWLILSSTIVPIVSGIFFSKSEIPAPLNVTTGAFGFTYSSISLAPDGTLPVTKVNIPPSALKYSIAAIFS